MEADMRAGGAGVCGLIRTAILLILVRVLQNIVEDRGCADASQRPLRGWGPAELDGLWAGLGRGCARTRGECAWLGRRGIPGAQNTASALGFQLIALKPQSNMGQLAAHGWCTSCSDMHPFALTQRGCKAQSLGSPSCGACMRVTVVLCLPWL